LSQVSRSPRLRKRFPVEFSAEGTLHHEGLTLNLSPTGVALRGNAVFAPGTALLLVVSPRDERPYRLEATVVWSRESTGEMGTKLIDPHERYLSFLTRATTESGRPMPAEGPLAPDARDRTWVPMPFHLASETLEHPSSPPTSSGAAQLPAGPEQLRSVRFEDQLPARISGGIHTDRRAFTQNVSRTGLYLTCESNFAAGTRVKVNVTLPDETVAHVSGVVAWSRTIAGEAALCHVGVRIRHPDELYLRLVDERASRSP